MKTYHVGPDAVALGLNEGEIYKAAALVRQSLKQQGIMPWERIETEIFSLNGENLLIARPASPRISRLKGRAPRLKRC